MTKKNYFQKFDNLRHDITRQTRLYNYNNITNFYHQPNIRTARKRKQIIYKNHSQCDHTNLITKIQFEHDHTHLFCRLIRSEAPEPRRLYHCITDRQKSSGPGLLFSVFPEHLPAISPTIGGTGNPSFPLWAELQPFRKPSISGPRTATSEPPEGAEPRGYK